MLVKTNTFVNLSIDNSHYYKIISKRFNIQISRSVNLISGCFTKGVFHSPITKQNKNFFLNLGKCENYQNYKHSHFSLLRFCFCFFCSHLTISCSLQKITYTFCLTPNINAGLYKKSKVSSIFVFSSSLLKFCIIPYDFDLVNLPFDTNTFPFYFLENSKILCQGLFSGIAVKGSKAKKIMTLKPSPINLYNKYINFQLSLPIYTIMFEGLP